VVGRAGETVADVPSTATARVRELSRGGRRKNDALDAAAAASVAALHGDAVPVAAEDASTVLGMLDERRLNLTQQRTRTVNQLHALLRDLLPGGAPTDLTASQAAAVLDRYRRWNERVRTSLGNWSPTSECLMTGSRTTSNACTTRWPSRAAP
jgi:transposase